MKSRVESMPSQGSCQKTSHLSFIPIIIFFCFGLLIAGTASASLTVVGKATYNNNDYNLIYDDDTQLTWLDYTNSWASASSQQSWAAGLNSSMTYTFNEGFTPSWGSSVWRLPETITGPNVWGTEGDPNGDGVYTYDIGTNLANSEMGHLNYNEFSGNNPFSNLNSVGTYYSDTSRPVGTTYWFRFSDGLQNFGTANGLGLAVRSGEVVYDAGAPDQDNDGVADNDDNCPEVANSDQLDIDADGVGAACDANDNYAAEQAARDQAAADYAAEQEARDQAAADLAAEQAARDQAAADFAAEQAARNQAAASFATSQATRDQAASDFAAEQAARDQAAADFATAQAARDQVAADFATAQAARNQAASDFAAEQAARDQAAADFAAAQAAREQAASDFAAAQAARDQAAADFANREQNTYNGPRAGCIACHSQPKGNRRQITPSDEGVGGDFGMNSHHVKGEAQNRDCGACHSMTQHGSGVVRLRDPDLGNDLIYEYDPQNPAGIEQFCLGCHDEDGGKKAKFHDDVTPPNIKGFPGSFWADSAHASIDFAPNGAKPVTCLGDGLTTGCHSNAHGSDNVKLLNAEAGVPQDQFCNACHTEGKITNHALAGDVDDIEQAFNSTVKHDVGSEFTVYSKTFTLQCSSCHNPHVVTGKHSDVNNQVSPITRPDFTSDPTENKHAMGVTLWGAATGEKMIDYVTAGDGTYRTPSGDTFLDFQLPDYNTFCLDCHAQPNDEADTHGNFGINWTSDPHGTKSANAPNGYGVCPNWYGCGKAEGWDGDDCVSEDPSDCWPVITRGKGDQLWTRKPYNHEERVSGANFTMACVDCHEAHGSGVSSMLRGTVNSGPGTQIWNTMCNNCHYYYSDWHAGMSCGTASCHISNSIHRAGSMGSSGTPRSSFDQDLVIHYAFEGNLKDSGDWQMDGKWYNNVSGSYAAGQVGNAIVLDGGKNVQVGTENDYWSTDAGRHGTHIYTEMKFNTTLEAWVYPTDDNNSEYSIFTKHVGYNSGGYGFTLQKIGSNLRAAFKAQIDNNGTDQDGMAGVRGAYSSVAIPLNTWTHVAATFDTSQAGRDDNDPTVGRIRIYVNGEDVTTSDASGNYMQPAASETSIYAYPENSPWNEEICYNGHWCTGEFSVGGFNEWQNEFIGMLDEAKVWNITKNAGYFAPIDAIVAPDIVSVTVDAPDQLLVYFSEGVFGSGASNELVPADLKLNYPEISILSVYHTAGDSSALVVLSSPINPADIGVLTIESSAGAIVDDYNLTVGIDPVVVTGSLCPSPAVFLLNEDSCSSSAQDMDGYLDGVVSGGCSTFMGDGYFYGDGDSGNDNYIDFNDADACMYSSTALTIEARIKPTGIGTANYVRRVIAKDEGGANYQVSVWRNNGWAEYNAPDGTASIAMWVPPVDAHGGTAWKMFKTDYNSCPIVSDHWYQVKIVWNSDKTGGIPGDIFVDDQGVDPYSSGNELATENWSGYLNCTDSAQAQTPATRYFLEGDQIISGETNTRIGANINNSANNQFNGLIDWISVQPAVDYSGVDETPNPPQQ